jgi:pimeloyl-ACP methyl ester carboxylesterase
MGFAWTVRGHHTVPPSSLHEHQSKFSVKIERINLKHGLTRYELNKSIEENSKPLVVCLHGIGSYSFVWRDVTKILNREGFDVLSLDFYGRGFSDSPITKHDGHLYCEQVRDLLEALKMDDRKIILLGHSMGGAVSTLFASKYPDRVEKLILFSPAGVELAIKAKLAMAAAKLPVIPDFIFHNIVPIGVSKRPEKPFYKPERIPELIKYAQTMATQQLKHNKGFLRSYLRTLRDFKDIGGLKHAYETVEKHQIPTVVFWGTKDKVIPYKSTKCIRQWTPSAKIHTLEET